MLRKTERDVNLFLLFAFRTFQIFQFKIILTIQFCSLFMFYVSFSFEYETEYIVHGFCNN
jgi:hypothetical protein